MSGLDVSTGHVSVKQPKCPYCLDSVAGDDEKQGCPSCMAWSHTECWSEHGGCAACGRGAKPRATHAPPTQTAPPESSRWRGEQALGQLDPSVVLQELRRAFGTRGAVLGAETSWGFAFGAGRPKRLKGRVWLERQPTGAVVRWEITTTRAERLLLVLFMILSLPTVLLPLFALWSLLAYPRHYAERRVAAALLASARERPDRQP